MRTSLTGESPVVLDKIREILPSLSKAQSRLARYILESETDVAFMSLGDLCKRTRVSEATAIRFAQSIGYKGYPEFREDLQSLIKETITPVVKVRRTAESYANGLFGQAIDADLEILAQTRKDLSEEVFAEAVRIIANATEVYILALGVSRSLAAFLEYRLRQNAIRVRVVSQGGRSFFEGLASLGRDDAVIAVGFYRCAREILIGVDYAKEQGAKVIAVTDSVVSPLGKRADVVLPAKRGPVEILNSLAVPMSVVNALTVGVAVLRKQQTIETLEKVNRLFENYRRNS